MNRLVAMKSPLRSRPAHPNIDLRNRPPPSAERTRTTGAGEVVDLKAFSQGSIEYTSNRDLLFSLCKLIKNAAVHLLFSTAERLVTRGHSQGRFANHCATRFGRAACQRGYGARVSFAIAIGHFCRPDS